MGTLRVWEYFYYRGVDVPLATYYKTQGKSRGIIEKRLAELGFRVEDISDKQLEQKLLSINGCIIDIKKLSTFSAYLSYCQAHDHKYGTQLYNELSKALYTTATSFGTTIEDGKHEILKDLEYYAYHSDEYEAMLKKYHNNTEKEENTSSNNEQSTVSNGSDDNVLSSDGTGVNISADKVSSDKEDGVQQKVINPTTSKVSTDVKIETNKLFEPEKVNSTTQLEPAKEKKSNAIDVQTLTKELQSSIVEVHQSTSESIGTSRKIVAGSVIRVEDGVEYRALNDEEYCEKYYVSSDGKVYNSNNYELYGQNTKKGCILTLSNNGKVKRVFRALLIAQAFIENDKGYSDVLHKNGNVLDDNVSNLEWTLDAKVKDGDYSKYDFRLRAEEVEANGNYRASKQVTLHNNYTDEDIDFTSVKSAAKYVARVFGTKESSTLILLSRALNTHKAYRCFEIRETGV